MSDIVTVIGCGSIGMRHIRNLLALGVDVRAYDVNPERLARAVVGGAKPAEGMVASLDEAVAAIVATPPSLHVEQAREAVERGCHVLIEKPLAHGSAGIADLIEAVDAAGVQVLVACNMRFHPGIARLKELVEGGAVGRLLALSAQFGQYLPDWHPWEDHRTGYSARRALGGGVILDAIHEIDILRWLAGEVTEVSCMTAYVGDLGIETESLAEIALRFESGALGGVHLDYLQRAYHRSCRVVGEAGTLEWDWTANRVRRYSITNAGWSEEAACIDDWDVNSMYVDQTRHFLDIAAGAASPALDLRSGARVLDIALAAKRSASEGSIVSLEANDVGP